jgi:hypothetical protein
VQYDKKKKENIKIAKAEVQLSLITDNMILKIDNPKESIKNFIRTKKLIYKEYKVYIIYIIYIYIQ